MALAVAVSGGVDSLYVLALLRERFPVFALHARLHGEGDARMLAALSARCEELGVLLHILDLRARFSELVMRPFAEAYARGETPNPCTQCNRRVKFGLLLDEARKLGAEGLATGHYARLTDHPRYGRCLRRGVDRSKDQSYFLSLTRADRLALAVFPLGERRKEDVRAEMAAQGMAVPAERESQEICFVPGDDYRAFLRSSGVRLPEGGPMIYGDGLVVGRHEGLWNYTEGQRRGLGVAWSEPLYVLGKDRSRNALLLGTRAEIAIRSCVASRVNILVDPALWPNEVLVQTRYRQRAVPADVRLQGHPPDRAARLLIRFHEPQVPAAPGQIAALFDAEGHVLAGGVVTRDG